MGNRPVIVLHLVKTAVGATWAYRQMRELVRLGLEVHVATPDGPLVERYRQAGVHVHLLRDVPSLSRPGPTLRTLHALRTLVGRVRPDVLHSHFVVTTLLMRMALPRHETPRVFQVPGPLHLEHLPFRALDIHTASPQDFWISTCAWTHRRYLQSGVPANRVFLSYYGIDIADFARAPPSPIRAFLGIPSHTAIVGMVAYMYPPKHYLAQTRGLKGHEDFIDALALCLTRGRDVVGVFVGGSWGHGSGYEKRVRAYGHRSCGDRAIFLGTRNDVAALYPAFDVAVHPSHSENLGGSVESLLRQVPTIATEVGGFPDIIIPGQTGWLVPPRSPRALADAIDEALDDRATAARMAAEGADRARAMFDVCETARQVAQFYSVLLKGNGAGAALDAQHR